MTTVQWMTFWEVLIAVAVGGFTLLAAYVAIAGVADIRAMLRRMKLADDEEASHETSGNITP